ncbi:hypothetical protein OIT44_02775 [Weissella ceti]|uniref:Uncharacterized protein n=1 Tax=Weissella ceti TaxID=759620 RepID=A0ABT3E3K3_9LACO|nr:hypothetical protein [Weissella ceti]MCW0952995.1 hypothetical protein [Weissella ceti]QVK11541.1 hypothetical protein KHQ31_04785 [Weissella ceti]
MKQFQQFNKQNGMWVGESDLPDMTDGIENTEVPVRAKTLPVSVMVFDRTIQDWREVTPEQWRVHLDKVTPEKPSEIDEYMATTTMAIAELSKTNMMLTMTNEKQARTISAIENRLAELESKGDN